MRKVHTKILDEIKSSNWWPDDTPFEIIAGAVLHSRQNGKIWKRFHRIILLNHRFVSDLKTKDHIFKN